MSSIAGGSSHAFGLSTKELDWISATKKTLASASMDDIAKLKGESLTFSPATIKALVLNVAYTAQKAKLLQILPEYSLEMLRDTPEMIEVVKRALLSGFDLSIMTASEEKRMEVLKLLVEKTTPFEIFKLLPKVKVTNQEFLLEIGLICLKRDLSICLYDLDSLGLIDSTARISLLQAAINENSAVFCRVLLASGGKGLFGLQKQSDQSALLMELAKKEPTEMIAVMAYAEISDPVIVLGVLKDCLVESAKEDPEKGVCFFVKLLEKAVEPEKIYAFLANLSKDTEAFIAWIKACREGHDKFDLEKLVAASSQLYPMASQQRLVFNKMLNMICQFQDLALRAQLLEHVLEVLHKGGDAVENLFLFAQKPAVKDKGRQFYEAKYSCFNAALLSLMFSQLGMDKELKGTFDHLQILINNRYFQTGHIQKILTETLFSITSFLRIHPEKIEEVRKLMMGLHDLDRELPGPQLLDALSMIKNILFLKGTTLSKSEIEATTPFDLCLNALLNRLHIDDTIDKASFAKFIKTFRHPAAIFTYLCTLEKLSEDKEACLSVYKNYLLSNFSNAFSHLRYATEDNPHLQAAFSSKEGLREAWMAGRSLSKTDMQSLRTRCPQLNDYVLSDNDDFQNLIYCGTEIINSCQHVAEEPKTAKCLLDYMADGKNRLISLNKATGELLSRAVFRLLLDTDHKPALFIEAQYPLTITEDVRRIMVEFAIERARELGLPLYMAKESSLSAYFTALPVLSALQSIKAVAPFEYVDCSSLGVTDGSYTLMKSDLFRLI